MTKDDDVQLGAADDVARKAMTSLLVCRERPFPAQGGSPLRILQQIYALSKIGPVHVISIGESASGASHPSYVASWVNIDSSQDELGIDSTLTRLLSITRVREYPVTGTRAGTEVDRRIREALSTLAPDLVVVSHWETAFPRALMSVQTKIVDSHNVEWRLRFDGAFPAGKTLLKGARLWVFKQREKRLYEAADAVWVTSESDAAEISRFAPRTRSVSVVPNAVDTDAYIPTNNGPIQDFSVVFIGAMDYFPNEAAAFELIDEVLPLARAVIPSLRLVIVGRNPSARLRAAASSHVMVAGNVPDVRPFLAAATVTVVPLRMGGGTRLKILEAFAAGVPVVSTAKGAEGIYDPSEASLLIAETHTEMADAIIRLIDDAPFRRELISNARRVVEERFSWHSTAMRVRSLIASLRG